MMSLAKFYSDTCEFVKVMQKYFCFFSGHTVYYSNSTTQLTKLSTYSTSNSFACQLIKWAYSS